MQDPEFRVISEDSFANAPAQEEYPELLVDENGRELTPECRGKAR